VVRPVSEVGVQEDAGGPERAAEALIGRAGRAAGWLARTGWRVTRALPGGALAQRQLVKLEEAVVTEVRRRLEATEASPGFAWRLPGAVGEPVRGLAGLGDHELVTLIRPMNGHVQPLRAGMAELLNQSANADTAMAHETLYATILRQLVPDEARIVAVLADGQPRPSVDVQVRGPLGGVLAVVLRNASSVGRDAGVSAPGDVPTYLTRLHRLGLVDIGAEDPALGERYEILLTEQLVHDAEELARGARKGSAKIVRRTVVISELGQRFWAECDPTSAGAPHLPPARPVRQLDAPPD
jgi:hypothetical protein